MLRSLLVFVPVILRAGSGFATNSRVNCATGISTGRSLTSSHRYHTSCPGNESVRGDARGCDLSAA